MLRYVTKCMAFAGIANRERLLRRQRSHGVRRAPGTLFRSQMSINSLGAVHQDGSVSRRNASCRYLVAVDTSSKPRELTAYLAHFCASVTAVSDGEKPGAGVYAARRIKLPALTFKTEVPAQKLPAERQMHE